MQRRTWQRDAVQYALRRRDDFVTAQGLHTELAASGAGVGLATVYRALNDMVDAGEVDALQSPTGEALYRACRTGAHHHHLICRDCGRAVEIEADAVEQWAKDTAASHGFSDPVHVVDIFGTCEKCALRDVRRV